MSPITTHVLDTARGKPAEGLEIVLECESETDWETIGIGSTNSDGRISDLMSDDMTLSAGNYRMIFNTGSYFETLGLNTFYPKAVIYFTISATDEHYHVPLLLSPFGYSTYRGS